MKFVKSCSGSLFLSFLTFGSSIKINILRLFLFHSLLFSLGANGQDGSGSVPKCASQSGSWTQKATEMSNEIRSAIIDLVKARKCSFLGLSELNYLAGNASYLETAREMSKDKQNGQEVRKEFKGALDDPQDLQAANSLAAGDPGAFGVFAKNLLASKSLKTASLKGYIASGVKAGVNSGVELAGKIFGSLADKDNMECIRAGGVDITGLINSSISLFNSVSGNAYVDSTKLNSTMTQIASALKQSHIRDALGERATFKFWNNLSCLIESATDTHCALHDAYQLNIDMSENMDELQRKSSPNTEKYSPLQSYFVLTRDIPNIASWVLEILFGHEPVTMAEGKRKNLVWETFINLLLDENTGTSVINEKVLVTKEIYNNASSENGPKAKIIEIIDMVANTVSSRFDKGENFFTSNYVKEEIPFKLLGLEVPPPVKGSTDNGDNKWTDECGRTWQIMGASKNWKQYLTGNGDYHCIFDNPEYVIQKIKENFRSMMKMAKIQALDYLNKFLVVDKVDLATRSFSSTGVSVMDSIYNLYNFLQNFKERVVSHKNNVEKNFTGQLREKELLGANTVLNNIGNLIPKIERIIGAIKRQASLAGKPNIKDYEEAVKETAEEIVKTVFSEFNVVYQQSNFLKRRIETYVNYDMRLFIRDENVDEGIKNWLVVSENSLALLGGVINDNFETYNATKELEIENALSISHNNLSVLEDFTKDYFLGAIVQMNAILDGTYKEGKFFADMVYKRFENESASTKLDHEFETEFYNAKSDEERSAIVERFGKRYANLSSRKIFAPINDLVGRFFKSSYYIWLHGDRYPARFKWDMDQVGFAQYSNEGALKGLRDKYCIQSLFYLRNRPLLKTLCGGAELHNAYIDKNYVKEDVYDRKLKLSYDKLYYLPGEKHVERVCALRDYKRNNHAYTLLKEIERNSFGE